MSAIRVLLVQPGLHGGLVGDLTIRSSVEASTGWVQGLLRQNSEGDREQAVAGVELCPDQRAIVEVDEIFRQSVENACELVSHVMSGHMTRPACWSIHRVDGGNFSELADPSAGVAFLLILAKRQLSEMCQEQRLKCKLAWICSPQGDTSTLEHIAATGELGGADPASSKLFKKVGEIDQKLAAVVAHNANLQAAIQKTAARRKGLVRLVVIPTSNGKVDAAVRVMRACTFHELISGLALLQAREVYDVLSSVRCITAFVLSAGQGLMPAMTVLLFMLLWYALPSEWPWVLTCAAIALGVALIASQVAISAYRLRANERDTADNESQQIGRLLDTEALLLPEVWQGMLRELTSALARHPRLYVFFVKRMCHWLEKRVPCSGASKASLIRLAFPKWCMAVIVGMGLALGSVRIWDCEIAEAVIPTGDSIRSIDVHYDTGDGSYPYGAPVSQADGVLEVGKSGYIDIETESKWRASWRLYVSCGSEAGVEASAGVPGVRSPAMTCRLADEGPSVNRSLGRNGQMQLRYHLYLPPRVRNFTVTVEVITHSNRRVKRQARRYRWNPDLDKPVEINSEQGENKR